MQIEDLRNVQNKLVTQIEPGPKQNNNKKCLANELKI